MLGRQNYFLICVFKYFVKLRMESNSSKIMTMNSAVLISWSHGNIRILTKLHTKWVTTSIKPIISNLLCL